MSDDLHPLDHQHADHACAVDHARQRPPDDRAGVTRRYRLSAVDLHVTLNRYADGRPCELFAGFGLGTEHEIGRASCRERV